MIPMLPPVWDMVLPDLEVSLNLYVFLRQTSQGLAGPRTLLTPSKVNTLNKHRQANLHLIFLKGKPLCSHMIWWKNPVHPDTPIMIGWITSDRVHWKSSAWKVTHPSTTPALTLHLCIIIPVIMNLLTTLVLSRLSAKHGSIHVQAKF